MSLRFKINLIVAMLMLTFVGALIAREIDATRRSVREEVAAANRVATQLLQRVSWVYSRDGLPALEGFLIRLGRVRANDIELRDQSGQLLYRSPPSPYKEGINAPEWFANWVLPGEAQQQIDLPGGRLLVRADASRAVLDGWEDLQNLAALASFGIVIVNLIVFGLVGRTLRPFPTIVAGLERLESGDFSTRLPRLSGQEASMIGAAFNRMATALQEQMDVRRQAREAEQRLSESRELTQLIEEHLEQERRTIARELHDELGQSVTAIRSLALSIARRPNCDADGAKAAELIAAEAGHLYDAMHGLIPRLSPLTLDSLGLADTLRELVEQHRERHPHMDITLEVAELPENIEPNVALAAYRVIQEGLTNVLRHSQASAVRVGTGVAANLLEVTVSDNGSGLSDDWQAPGHFGLRGLRERLAGFGGSLEVANREGGGTLLRAALPLVRETTR